MSLACGALGYRFGRLELALLLHTWIAHPAPCDERLGTDTFADPDERQEQLFAIKGKDSRFCINELDQILRQVLKYQVAGQDSLGTFQLDERTVSWVRQRLNEIVEDANLPEIA